MKEIIISLLAVIGTFFIFSASLGIIRLPDVYTRLHAATKSATLGVIGILLAAFLYFLYEHQVFSGKLLLGILFVMMTSPIAGHMISRAAYRVGVALDEKTIRDDLEPYLEKEEELRKEMKRREEGL